MFAHGHAVRQVAAVDFERALVELGDGTRDGAAQARREPQGDDLNDTEQQCDDDQADTHGMANAHGGGKQPGV